VPWHRSTRTISLFKYSGRTRRGRRRLAWHDVLLQHLRPRVEAKTQRVGRDAQRRCGKPPLSNSEAMLGAVSAGRLPLKRGLARPGGRFRRFCAWRIFAGARAMINYVNLPSKERPHLRLRSVGSSLNLVEAPRRVLNSVHDRVGNLFGGHQSRKIGVGARHACKARRRRAAATPRTRP
jgi:hypothetical protein